MQLRRACPWKEAAKTWGAVWVPPGVRTWHSSSRSVGPARVWVSPSSSRRWQPLLFLAQCRARAASACRDGNGESAAAKSSSAPQTASLWSCSRCFVGGGDLPRPFAWLCLALERNFRPSREGLKPCRGEKVPSHRRQCCSEEALSSRRAAWQLLELPAAASLRTARPPWPARSFRSHRWVKIAQRVSKTSAVLQARDSEGVANLIHNEAFSELHPQPLPREASRLQAVPAPEGGCCPFCPKQHFHAGRGSRPQWLEVWGRNWLLAALDAAGWRCGSCLRCDSVRGDGLTHHQPRDSSLNTLPGKDLDVLLVLFMCFFLH